MSLMLFCQEALQTQDDKKNLSIEESIYKNFTQTALRKVHFLFVPQLYVLEIFLFICGVTHNFIDSIKHL